MKKVSSELCLNRYDEMVAALTKVVGNVTDSSEEILFRDENNEKDWLMLSFRKEYNEASEESEVTIWKWYPSEDGKEEAFALFGGENLRIETCAQVLNWIYRTICEIAK